MIKRNVVTILCSIVILCVGFTVAQDLTKEEKRARRKAVRSLLKEINTLVTQEAFIEAEPLIDSLLLLDAENADGFFHKGFIKYKLADTVGALEVLQQGITVAPLSTRLQVLAARLYIAQNNPAQANIYVTNILKVKPKEAETLYLQGEIYLLQGDTTAAAESFRLALESKLEGK